MIQIKLNGKQFKVATGKTILELLDLHNIAPEKVAIEHNAIILSQDNYNKTIINNDDNIEIVEFVGGG